MENDINKLCLACFGYTLEGDTCCACGTQAQALPAAPHHLPPRSVLGGKYLSGGVLGEGGFGITYLGWDINLEVKVAIKEFFPLGAATRNSTVSDTVQALANDQTQEIYSQGRERFIDEARRLAKFYALPGIVSVKDFFQENGTAYIVMEFVEGQDLKNYLETTGGRMDAGVLLELFKPLVQSLAQVHNAGIIHRDISPDNIILTPDGQLRLIDFGAARDFNNDNKSLSVLLKPGYAPEEQYRSRGKQGPWTDIYALCATLYRAIEGQKPPEAMERMLDDNLGGFTQTIPAQAGEAILKGLAVRQENRWQSLEELYAALYPPAQPAPKKAPKAATVPVPAAPPNETDATPPKKKKALPFVVAGAAVLCLLLVVLLPRGGDEGRIDSDTAETQSAQQDEPQQTGADPAAEPGADFVVTQEGANGTGTYEGDIVDGLASGMGTWTTENYVYTGSWKNGKPNGQGTLVHYNEIPEDPEPGSYALIVETTGTFVDGILDGPLTLVWTMDDGETLRWEYEVSMGRVAQEAKVTATNGATRLTVRPSNLNAVPPWTDGKDIPASTGTSEPFDPSTAVHPGFAGYFTGEPGSYGYMFVDIYDEYNARFVLVDSNIQPEYHITHTNTYSLVYGWEIEFNEGEFSLGLMGWYFEDDEIRTLDEMQAGLWHYDPAEQHSDITDAKITLTTGEDYIQWEIELPPELGLRFTDYDSDSYPVVITTPEGRWEGLLYRA